MHVQVISPAQVSTKMCPVPPSLTAPTADTYAAAAVKHIGYEDHAVPYWGHALYRCDPLQCSKAPQLQILQDLCVRYI